MGKKVTMQQRLIMFAFGATDEELKMAIDTLKACLDTRSPKKPRATRKAKAKPTPTPTSTKSADDAIGE